MVSPVIVSGSKPKGWILFKLNTTIYHSEWIQLKKVWIRCKRRLNMRRYNPSEWVDWVKKFGSGASGVWRTDTGGCSPPLRRTLSGKKVKLHNKSTFSSAPTIDRTWKRYCCNSREFISWLETIFQTSGLVFSCLLRENKRLHSRPAISPPTDAHYCWQWTWSPQTSHIDLSWSPMKFSTSLLFSSFFLRFHFYRWSLLLAMSI